LQDKKDLQTFDWFFDYNKIKGENYEKSMINHLKKEVFDIIVNIFY